MEPILILVVAFVIAVAIGYVVRRAGGPGDPQQPTPPRPEHSPTGTEDDAAPDIPPYPTGGRPGGPGAESMNSSQPGDAAPGSVEGDSDTPDAIAPSEAGRKRLDDEA